MQNIQDVKNAKKIISKQDSSESLSNLDSDYDIDDDDNSKSEEYDVDNQEMSLKSCDHQVQDHDLDMILEESGIHEEISGLTNFQLEENVCGNLTRKKQHVIHDPVSSKESALIQQSFDVSDGQNSLTMDSQDHQQTSDIGRTDVIKVILNLDQNVESYEPRWDELKK
jgi:hypothetical protein